MSFLDVKDCGAIGDGVTDDTQAIQAALDIAPQVYFPPGNYRINRPALTLRTGHHLLGAGHASRIFTDAEDSNLIEGIQVDDVIIDKLRFEGTNTASAYNNGCGVYFSSGGSAGCKRLTVSNCFFKNFGDEGGVGGNAIMFSNACEDITVDNNFIDGGIGPGENSDILVYGASGYASITNNKCYSPNSGGIALNPTNPVGRIIVQGNICRNKVRHGIMPIYGNHGPVDTIIDSNICIDCDLTGIYVAGSPAGSILITNNIIDACAGDEAADVNSLTAAIWVTGENPTVIANNYVINAGKNSAGTPRGGRGWGIKLVNNKECLIDGNTVIKGTGPGIHVYNTTTNVSIKNNTLIDNAFENLAVEIAGVDATCVEIQNNRIAAKTVDAHGITLGYLHESAKNVFVCDNIIAGMMEDTGKAGLFLGFTFEGVLRGNVISNWDFGLKCNGSTASFLDGRVVFADNNIVDNDVGIYTELSNLGDNALGMRNWLAGNANDYDDGGGGYLDNLWHGISIFPRRMMYGSVSPAGGTWAIGDIVLNTAPTAGGFIGWVCTGAGAPGTWKTFGAISV